MKEVGMKGTVVAVSSSAKHALIKENRKAVRLLEGLGVEGDAHMGATVKHRSIAAKDPDRPNLRQVHLIHAELLDELKGKGFAVLPGQMGENITTGGIALLELPRGTRLHVGDTAVVEITGLRDPCAQLNRLQAGLMAAVLDEDEKGRIVRKTGVMSVVISAGVVRPGDDIVVKLPPLPHQPLTTV